MSGNCLTCYSDVEANQWKFCDEDDGFNTCFATYDQSKILYFWPGLMCKHTMALHSSLAPHSN